MDKIKMGSNGGLMEGVIEGSVLGRPGIIKKY